MGEQGLIKLVLDKHLANTFLGGHHAIEGHYLVWLVKEDFLCREG